MTRPRPTALATALGALVVLGVGGCGTSTPPAAEPETTAAARPSLLPPRLTDLRVDDGIDACALLTVAQRTQLKVESINRSPRGELSGCDFHVGGLKRDYSWGIRFERPRSVEEAARGEGATVVDVSGFPAVRTRSSIFNPAYSCLYLIDVAPEQTLNVAFANDHKDIPGMNHELACQQDAKVAELIVANLRTLAH